MVGVTNGQSMGRELEMGRVTNGCSNITNDKHLNISY